MQGDSLALSRRPGVFVSLNPTWQDGFARGGTGYWFTRGRDGRVDALHVSDARVWDLVFRKVQ